MAEPLTEPQVREALAELPGWTRADEAITKTYTFSHFREAVSFLVRIAFSAEGANHHPELWNVYNRVRVTLSTHDAGGRVTAKDVALAGEIEQLSWVE
jgi:4a-hydroxytetrahydrobiopterin dehydratase